MEKSRSTSLAAWILSGFSINQGNRSLIGCDRKRRTNVKRRCSVHCTIQGNEKNSSKDKYNQFAELLNKMSSFPDRGSTSTPDLSKEKSRNDSSSDMSSSDSKGFKSTGSQRLSEQDEGVKELYDHFAEKIGHDELRVDTEGKEEKLKQQYAKFADRIGVEDKHRVNLSASPETGLSSEPESSSIDPAEYSKFESLLNQTGGGGRKVVKGSRRWATSNSSSTSTDEPPHVSSHPTSISSDSVTNTPVRPSPSFSEADKSDGYAALAQKFGTSNHDTTNRSVHKPNAPLANPKPKNENLPTLMKPPSRPTNRSASQERPTIAQHKFEEDVFVPPAEMEPTIVLQPKPMMPSKAPLLDENPQQNDLHENTFVLGKDDQNKQDVLTPGSDLSIMSSNTSVLNSATSILNKKPIRHTLSGSSKRQPPENDKDSPAHSVSGDTKDAVVQNSKDPILKITNHVEEMERSSFAQKLRKRPDRRIEKVLDKNDGTLRKAKNYRLRGNKFERVDQIPLVLNDPKVIISK